jgi:RNA polymerase sigma-70 factor (ECF subfamily)
MLPFYLTMLDNENDKSRFEEFYKLHQQDMYKLAFRILKNKFDSEEAVSEAYLRITRNFSKIKDIHSKQSRKFALVTVKNISINIYNEIKKRQEDGIDDVGEICEANNIEDDIELKATVEEIKSAIRQLPSKYYNVLFYTLLCECTVMEASDLLGISYESCKKINQRAKRKIQTIIDSEVYAYE